MQEIHSGVFSFDGNLATGHRMSARDLGPALIGLDTIVTCLLGALERGKVVTKRPSDTFLTLSVKEAQEGSFEIPWLTEFAATMLPLYPSFTEAIRNNLIESFVTYVMTLFGGRKKEADANMEKMLDMLDRASERAHESQKQEREASYADRQLEREASYADRQRERESNRLLLHEQALALHSAAKSAVTPVGRSASQFSTSASGSRGTTIDEATADAIRQKEELEVSDLLTMTFEIDGIRDSKSQIYVFNPEVEERTTLTVYVSDPSFQNSDNEYKKAYFSGMMVKLTGKATRYKSGGLKCFHAINAEAI